LKINSPRNIALAIASISAFVFLLLFLISSILGLKLFICILGAIGLFFLIYLFSIFFLNSFLFERINPLYRALYNTTIQEKGFTNKMKGENVLKQVNDEVENLQKNKKQEIDQLKQLEKYRREFLGNVSHELKTPIFNIQGYILTLLDGGLEDSSINRLYLERTEKSINRMINIVEDLESISRLESGELKLDPEEFDIVSLVNEVFEMQEMLAAKCHIKLKFDKNYDNQIMVFADKKRITEALNNLIVNSLKYGKKHGKTIVSFNDIGNHIIIEVLDTGIGIAEGDQARIFERFYRADKSRSRDQGGTGLGLSIVKHIIEAHQQKIKVQSKPGEGSVFSFTLEKSS
jgi:two-component system phosphate regulon sensor histidine kinase PhoR